MRDGWSDGAAMLPASVSPWRQAARPPSARKPQVSSAGKRLAGRRGAEDACRFALVAPWRLPPSAWREALEAGLRPLASAAEEEDDKEYRRFCQDDRRSGG